MSEELSLSLFDSLSHVPDPRRERTKRHQLVDIPVIAVCATICAAETWEEIEEFGQAKEMWFQEFLALHNGIPSHDTFRRVFLRIKSEEVSGGVSRPGALCSQPGGRRLGLN
jgi:DDE_Tnp_1-associated